MPKTTNNLKAIQQSHLSDIEKGTNDFPHSGHKAAYYRNGVPIVQNGLGLLWSIADRITFTIAFGNMENTKWLEGKLNEISPGGTNHILWDESTEYMRKGADIGFPILNYGLGGPSLGVNQYIRPVVSVDWVIDKIAHTHGLTIERGTHFKDMFIPLLSTNSDPASINHGELFAAMDVGGRAFTFRPVTDRRGLFVSGNTFNTQSGETLFVELGEFSGEIMVYHSSEARPTVQVTREIKSTIKKATLSSLTINAVFSHYLNDGTGVYTYTFPELKDYFETGKDDDIVFLLDIKIGVFEGHNKITTGAYLHFRPQFTDTVYKGLSPVVENLPDMKQVQFLKYMMHLRGLFAYAKSPNVIGMVSCDDIVAAKDEAQDWTDKLVTDSFMPNAPEELVFALDGFNQRNWLRWDNDEEVDSNKTDAFFEVAGGGLVDDKDIIKLPFSGTVDKGGTSPHAYIPLYTVEKEEGKEDKIVLNKVKDRVLININEEDPIMPVFKGLDFHSIIAHYYKSYIDVVKAPRVITVRVYLTDLELSKMSLIKPVYFEQFGRYYIILHMQSSPSRLCKVKLLEISV